jgi:hypothetical protein
LQNGFLLPWIGHGCREASSEGASRGYSAMQPRQRVGTRTQDGGALLAGDVMVAACSVQVEVASDARWGSEVRCRGSVAACGPRIGQHVGGVGPSSGGVGACTGCPRKRRRRPCCAMEVRLAAGTAAAAQQPPRS